MLPLRVMAQMSNYRTDNKTQVHHKAPTPHIPILYLSKRFFTGGGELTKTSHTFIRGETSSVPAHCLHTGPAASAPLRARARSQWPRRGLAGPCAPAAAAPLPALRHPRPRSGRAPHAGPWSPKWLPAPTKPAASGPGPRAPVTRPLWIHWRRRPGRPHRLNPCGSAAPPLHSAQQKPCFTSPATLLKSLTCPMEHPRYYRPN